MTESSVKGNVSPRDGAQRKRDHDRRKREAGLKEFRAWTTQDEADFLREILLRLRANNIGNTK